MTRAERAPAGHRPLAAQETVQQAELQARHLLHLSTKIQVGWLGLSACWPTTLGPVPQVCTCRRAASSMSGPWLASSGGH